MEASFPKQAQYKIGELSKITGLSLATIRRYEDAGLLHVTRDENSGYRTYQALDVAVLIRIKMYRNFGFSIQEIVELFNREKEHKINLFEENQRRLKTQIEKLKRIAEVGQAQLETLRLLPQSVGVIQEEIREEWLGLIYRTREDIQLSQETNEAIATWIEQAPLVQQLFLVEPQDFLSGNGNYEVGIRIQKDYAEFCHLPLPSTMRRFKRQRVLTVIVEAIGEFKIDPSLRDLLLHYLSDRHLILAGAILASTIISEYNHHDIVHYQKLYIPIKCENSDI